LKIEKGGQGGRVEKPNERNKTTWKQNSQSPGRPKKYALSIVSRTGSFRVPKGGMEVN